MKYQTRPTPTPKPAVASREEALFDGALIDLDEIEVAPHSGSIPLPTALTDALLETIETLPFAQIGSVTVADRAAEVLRRAADAFERARAEFGGELPRVLHFGFFLDFSVRLPTRAASHPHRFVRLHCGPDETGEVVATLGLAEEF